MRELLSSIPDIDVLLSMEPEELAGKILFLLQRRSGDAFSVYNEVLAVESPDRLENANYFTPTPTYPKHKIEMASLAVTEAFAWLEAQVLIVTQPRNSGSWKILSRRGRSIATDADFDAYLKAKMLPREILHPRIAEPVSQAFARGEYDVAAFLAMKAVEVRVRQAAGFGSNMLGKALMQEAFKPDGGALTDMSAEPSERQGRMNLFLGAISSYKNPHSHRAVDLDDPAEAIEIIMLANHLLRITDAREGANAAA